MGNLSHRTDSILHSLGLEITSDELYSEDQPSLNNAVIQPGGFWSGVVVSDQGLVFTNHHCGFDAIQNHSSVKHDYLKNGFFAKTLKDELPNEGLYVLFHLKTIDVTDRILGPIPDIAGERERSRMIDSIANSIIKEVNYNNDNVFGEINPFYQGSKFFLSVYQKYDDVRLVAAPPQCLGKYGGDTDNWMWPRQTCDFSVFRIYAGKDNRPAEYSPENVPYHPRRYAHVSLQGIKDGDFSMTLGYPGSTDRYLSSYGIFNTMHCVNDVRYQVRTVKLDVMKAAMKQSDKLRIMYASKQAQSSNYWKYSLAQNTALENLKVLDEKRSLEAKVQAWIDADTVAHSRYVGMLDSIKALSEANFQELRAANMFVESFIQGSDILQNLVYYSFGRGANRPFKSLIEENYKDIDIPTDKAIFAALLKNYIANVPVKEYIPTIMKTKIDSLYNGNVDAYVDDVYAKSVFADTNRLKFLTDIKDAADDPMFEAAMDVVSMYMQVASKRRNVNTVIYERLLGDAIREMNHDKEYYPDANFTMRLSYGLCKPINFAPGTTGLKEEARSLITTPQSFLNKYENASTDEEKYDYQLIDPVYKWMKKGKFSARYIDKTTGQLPLCFLTTNDITGGN